MAVPGCQQYVRRWLSDKPQRASPACGLYLSPSIAARRVIWRYQWRMRIHEKKKHSVGPLLLAASLGLTA